MLVALVTLFPIAWMVSTAFKPSQEIFSLTPHLTPVHPTLGNFSSVISGQASGIGSVWLFFRNSIAVTLATVLLASLLSLLASVAVARFRFRFRASVLVLLLIVQMIPGQALIIALFLDFKRLGLLENLLGLIIVYAAQALPVSIWMLRNFVATVPRELEEAAAIDGASAPDDLLADPVPARRTRPGRDQHLRVHHGLQRVHRRADVPRPGALDLHPADLRDLLLRPRRRAVGPDHGRLDHVHHSCHDLLPDRQAPPGRRARRGGGEGVTSEITADPSLGRLADALLIPPFPGLQAPDWVLAALAGGLAGVTVFGPNIGGAEQLAALIARLRAAARRAGHRDRRGRRRRHQARPPDGQPVPGQRRPRRGRRPRADQGRVPRRSAPISPALGVSLNLAPSVDVNTAAGNPVIGTRSFGADPALVARHAAAAVTGLQSAGVAACAKHFPGHGSTSIDSHDAHRDRDGLDGADRGHGTCRRSPPRSRPECAR